MQPRTLHGRHVLDFNQDTVYTRSLNALYVSIRRLGSIKWIPLQYGSFHHGVCRRYLPGVHAGYRVKCPTLRCFALGDPATATGSTVWRRWGCGAQQSKRADRLPTCSRALWRYSVSKKVIALSKAFMKKVEMSKKKSMNYSTFQVWLWLPARLTLGFAAMRATVLHLKVNNSRCTRMCFHFKK